MFNNYWTMVLPVWAILVWALAWRYWIIFVSNRPVKKFIRQSLWLITAAGAALMLIVESHRGIVQSLRNAANDPNGVDDFSYLVSAILFSMFVANVYAVVIYGVAKHIAKKMAKYAKLQCEAKQPQQPVTPARPRRRLPHLNVVLTDKTIDMFDVEAACMLPDEIQEVSVRCLFTGEYKIPEEDLPAFLETLPREIRDQAEVKDTTEAVA